MLISLCRSLTDSASFRAAEESTVDQELDHGWLAWLQGEEAVRLVHCICRKSKDMA